MAALFFLANKGHAAVIAPASTAQSADKKILVLVKRRDPNHENHAHYLGRHLNQAGFKYEVRDAEDLLVKPATDLGKYSGVVTAHLSPQMAGAENYPGFLLDQLRAKRPVVIVGSFGAYQALVPKPDKTLTETPRNRDQINTFFRPFGLEFDFAFCNDPKKLRVVRKEVEFAEYQTPLKPEELNHYQLFRSVNPQNKVHLAVERTDLPKSESAFVVQTPYGGMILEGYGFFWSPEKKDMIQRTNLVAFFKDSLAKVPPEVIPFVPPPRPKVAIPVSVPGSVPEAVPTTTASSRSFVGKIVLLYKRRDPNSEAYLQQVGKFVNDAGYDYDRRDIEELLRKPRDLSSYSGIVTAYLSSQMIGADKYPRFLVKQLEAGLPIVIIGQYGAYQGLLPKAGRLIPWNLSTRDVNTFFYPFGLEFHFGFTNDPTKIKVSRKVKEFSEFEALLLPKDLKYYQFFRSVYPTNQVYLEVERTDVVDSKSAFVAHTPFGGMILESFAFFWSNEKKALVQRVNLARFIKEGIEREVPEVPRYEIATHDTLLAANPLPRRAPPVVPPLLRHEISRRVLNVYKHKEAKNIEESPVLRRAGLVLHHLGILVDYWPVDVKGLPPPEVMERYRGILTWHTSPFMKGARKYGEWLLAQVRAGKRLAWMGEYGATIDPETQERPEIERQILKEMGIEWKRLPSARVQHKPKVRVQDDWMGFDRPIDPLLMEYSQRYRSVSPANTVHFSMQDQNWGPIDLVVTGPKGGVALESSAFWVPPECGAERFLTTKATDPQSLQGEGAESLSSKLFPGRWLVNPFAFFARVFDVEELPAPDFTTACGARIVYTHIDGDALDSVCLIDKAHLAGWMVKKYILEKYPQIAHTVSVISKLVEAGGNEYYHPAVQLAREIYRLPQVEMASHGATHPFDWTLEDPYLANPGEYPFKIDYKPFDFVCETWGSKLFIEKNLGLGKKRCEMILWTGGTNPPEKVMNITWRAGLQNLNSGDPILDRDHPSVAYLAPVGLTLGPYHKIHSSARNDFLYTDSMTGDWSAQRKLLEHFACTEKPRRLTPMNVYYHFYSGIKNESLAALTEIFDWLTAQIRMGQAISLFTSQYSRIAQDFYQTRLCREGPGVFTVVNGGELRTLRFSTHVHVDLNRSKGVLGYIHERGQTYVHLDGNKVRTVVLATTPPRGLYLRQSSMLVDRSRWLGDGLELSFHGLGWAVFSIAGAGPKASYRVTVEDSKGRTIAEEWLVADRSGLIRFERLLTSSPQAYMVRFIRDRRM